MLQPGRKYSAANGYRYGFNGQEKDNENAGQGNSYTAEFWQYDARIGRRWNIDPSPDASVSSYATFFNNPLSNIDIKGDTPTVHEAAQMTADSYNKFIDRRKIDGGWSRLASFGNIKFEDKATDFQSALYSRTVNGKTEYTFATAGTATGQDTWQDVIQLGGNSGQYAFSVEQAKSLKKLLQGKELTYTGHSLGGGTAASNALSTGGVAITFNAAGVSHLTKKNLALNQNAFIQAYILAGEAVDYYQGKLQSTADGNKFFVHPTLGRLNAGQAYVVKHTPQTVVVRGIHHTINAMMGALTKAGYQENGEGERVVPIIMIKLPERKLSQGSDNTINRENTPIHRKTYGPDEN